jgi:hypothetical protein
MHLMYISTESPKLLVKTALYGLGDDLPKTLGVTIMGPTIMGPTIVLKHVVLFLIAKTGEEVA